MTCNIKPKPTDYYISEKHDFDEFNVDQTVLISEECLKRVSFLHYEEEKDLFSKCDEWYPSANSYYNHTEDVDALEKVNSLLVGSDFTSATCLEKREPYKYDPYIDRDAQLRYLESSPLSFIILGKPDVGQQKLGRHLADFWNCVYIEPETLIEEEIESGSRAGECIEFNLRCGRAIGIDIILKLVEKRVKSDTAKHRGFVICGLPVIPNDFYEEDPVSSQSAIFTVKEIFEEVLGTAADICIPSKPQVSVSSKFEGEVEPSVPESSPQLESERHQQSPESVSEKVDVKTPIDLGEATSSTNEIDIGQDYEKQLNFLFDLLKDPFFIVYLQCGTIDVLNKRDSYRFDFSANQMLDTQNRTYDKMFRKYLIEQQDVELTDEMFDPDFIDIDDFRLKHLVKLPHDFKANVSSQLDRYHYTALNIIETRVLSHDPEYFIKVDARTKITRSLNIIKARLKIMPLQQVLVPKLLTDSNLDALFKTEDTLLMAEDDESIHEDNKNLTPKDCFKELKKRQTPSRTFMWAWSDWGSICPVSMKSGFIQNGDVKYAVQFMNKLFFLADYGAYLKFYRNPRPFLLPPFPRPSCKIFIFGPRLSGRTALAHCLAYFLNGTVLSTSKMLKKFMHEKQDEYLEKVKQMAIAKGIALLNEQRKVEAAELEKERIENIKEWVKTVINLLETIVTIMDEIEKEGEKEKFEISSFPMQMRKMETTDIEDDSEYAVALLKAREELSNLNFPIYTLDAATWKGFLKDRKKFLYYLPPHLSQKVEPKPATVFDDFVKDYINQALANAGYDGLQISGGSILEMFLNNIREAEKKYQSQGFGKGGWIIDGMMCNLEIIKDFYPDYIGDEVIVLQDSDSKFLLKRCEERGTTYFRNFREFFQSIGYHDAAWRSPSLTSTSTYKEGLVEEILTEILENDDFYHVQDDKEQERAQIHPRVEDYKKDLRTFQKDWANVKQYFLDHNVQPIEVALANKTLPDIFQEVIRIIQDRYRVNACQLTEEDRSEEVSKLGNQKIENKEVTAEDETVVDDKPEDTLENIRRYGDTYHFCPVTFFENFVLWKGKEEFATKFYDKVYLLSTQSDMQKFLKEPRKFVPQNFPNKFPPPRICVVGVSGCGKTHLSKLISENYGLIYISYEAFLKKCFNMTDGDTLNEMRIKDIQPGRLRSYLKLDKAMPEEIMQNLQKFWFEEPFKSKGFVIDDFPKRQSDVDFMVKHKLIPDIILYPSAEDTYIKTKFLDRYFNTWQESITKQQEEMEIKYSKALEKLKEQRSVRFNILIEERREKRYAKKLEISKTNANEEPDEGNDEDGPRLISSSQVSFDSVAEQEDIDEINRILDRELPQIIFDIPIIESPAAAISKMEPAIVELIQNDVEVIKKVKEKCLLEVIPFTEIALNLDNFDKTKIASFLVVEPFKFRGTSFFECCYDVSLEVANLLLSSGYFFLSKFGKTCPVQYHENINPVQMYLVAEENHNLYPVIHRSYIYFIVGEDQKLKFKANPLHYINVEFNFPLIPFKVAVTGPPKCGKTVLANRIKTEFGFKLVSRGQATRYILRSLIESDLAQNMESVLRKGWELTDEMVIRSVEAACFDKKAITQGVVFDGFPVNINEVKHLSFVDLVPNIVIDLVANKDEILECLSNDSPKGIIPKYSACFIKHIYEEWNREANDFRQWFDREYQVSTMIPINTCNWSVWHQSEAYLLSTFWEIKNYFQHIADDWPLRLANMLVTPLEFSERQSGYKAFCPACLHYSNILITEGEPPDRTGVVQFRQYFYWLCHDHIELFLKSPEVYLPPYNKHTMPSSLPKRVHLTEIPDNVYENGACAVCYKSKRIITKGQLKFAVLYNEKAYLFDSIDCLKKFLRVPQSFLFGIEFRTPTYPSLNYKELPVLGMLEQYVAKYIIKGISFISKRRPIIPGLSISASALLGLGLFIKVTNENAPTHLKPFYEEGFNLFNQRREKLLKYLDFMKTYRNPYLYYEEPLPDFKVPPSEKSESVTTMVSRIVDKCVDNIDIYLLNAESNNSSV